MKANELPVITERLLATMQDDGYKQAFLDNVAWVLGFFASYCERRGMQVITIEAAVRFCQEQFGFDYYEPSANLQHSLRRPLLALFEYYQTGSYLRMHPNKSVHANIPEAFGDQRRSQPQPETQISAIQDTYHIHHMQFQKTRRILKFQGIEPVSVATKEP